MAPHRWLIDEPVAHHRAPRDNFTLATDAAAIWTELGRSLLDDPPR